MPGKYYLKHMVNHSVDNKNRINDLNNNYKQMLKENAISYLKTTNDDINKKVEYLKNLTHDVYRYGRKYKYDCSLKNSDIKFIINSVEDSELYRIYYGNPVNATQSYNYTTGSNSYGYIILAIVILLILIVKINNS